MVNLAIRYVVTETADVVLILVSRTPSRASFHVGGTVWKTTPYPCVCLLCFTLRCRECRFVLHYTISEAEQDGAVIFSE